MIRHRSLGYLLALTLGVALVGPSDARAQAMAEYTAGPPFISETVPPNVLILLDNSGSMNRMAYEDTSEAFDATKTYTGLFDPAECYAHQTTFVTRFVPDVTANPTTMPAGGWTCQGNATYEWSGNLLNYASMRRIDIAKWVLVGGMCAGLRDANLGCSTVKGQDLPFASCCQDQTQAIPVGAVQDRMPSNLIPGSGSVYFHLKGSSSSLRGKFCVSNNSAVPSGSTCTDWSTANETYVILAAQLTNSTGVIQQVGTKARFGLMRFSTLGDDGGTVIAEIGSDLSSVVGAIEASVPQTSTPLAESLYEGARYMAQIDPAYNVADYTNNAGTADDPYYFVSPQWAGTSQSAPCCQSFAIVFTDGESTQDTNIPPDLGDEGSAAAGTQCTGNRGVPFVDPPGTTCNNDPDTPLHVLRKQHRTDYGSNGRHYLDDVALWAHTTDLRQGSIPVIGESGNDLTGIQSLTVYTFYAFGNISGRELLHTTAIAGAFDDQDSDGLPDAAGQTCTYPAGSPLGTGSATSSVEWDANQDCIADAYFESSDADDMRGQLMAAITSILQRSSSGSAASVLASSSTGEGALYQSFFFPTTFEGIDEINWTGYAQSLFLDAFGNLREDTNGDGTLTYEDDRIIRTRLDSATSNVVVDQFLDADGNGIADSDTPVATIGLRDVDAIWEAGRRLADKNESARKIVTWVDLDNDQAVDSGEQMDLTTANGTVLAPYLRAESAPSAYTANAIINFIRGCDPAACSEQASLRNRKLDVGGTLKVWKLGDAIYAQPIVVGAPGQRYDLVYGDSSYTAFFSQYKNRRQVAYLGANDGMLHAFNAGYFHRGDNPGTTTKQEHGWFTRTPTDNSGGPLLGEELWGFIPQELLPHLKWLAQPEYTHVYYVDLKPKATDVRIFTPDADHPNGWGTILMGGFRLGGSCGACTAGTGAPPMEVTGDLDNDGGTPDETRTFYSAYFVLDITNPESANFPKLLWTFSSADLGLTTSVPSMLRVSPKDDDITDNTNARWYMVAASGPTSYAAGTTQSGKLFAIDLAQGPGSGNGNVITLNAEALDSFMGDTLTVDRDLDYRVDASYMGSVIHDGTLPWRGKLYRLTMNECTSTPCSTNTWGIDDGGGNRIPTEILDTFPLSGSLDLGPIAAAPAVAIDDANMTWVFAGTGRLFDVVDKTTTDQQYFVGVKDSVVNGTCPETGVTACHVKDLVDLSTAKVCLVNEGDCGGSVDQVTNVAGATDFQSLIALVASKGGWYTTLPDPGERALSRPTVFGGIVFFPTFVPSIDTCSSSGESYLYALYYKTGSAYTESILGTEKPGTERYVKRNTKMGEGMATQAVVHMGQGGGEGQASIISTNSLSEVFQISVSTTGGISSRLVTWYIRAD